MPLFALSLAFLTGILLGRRMPLSTAWWIVLVLASAVWGILGQMRRSGWWRRWLPLSPGILLCFLLIGGLRYTLNLPDWNPDDLAYYNDRGEARITGWISAPPDGREDVQYLRMSMQEIQLLEGTGEVAQVRGDALVQIPAGLNLSMGDRLSFTAVLKTPKDEEDFSYRDYLSRQGIYSVIYHPGAIQSAGTHPVDPVRAVLEKLRQKAYRVIFALFPQPEAGLLSGILLGLDNDLPESVIQAYRDTGTAHIIAISGFNTTLIAGLFMAGFSRLFRRFPAFFLSAAAVALYAILVGGSPSVVRAAVMSALAMGGQLFGRKNSGLTALFFTAAVMCAGNPFLVKDVSFQLSFSATLGLVLFASPLQEQAQSLLNRWFSEEKAGHLISPLSEYFLFTLAAQATTLPVIAMQFNRFSISSFLANPLVLPLQPAVLYAGGAAVVLGTIWQPLGRLFTPFAWPLLAYTNRMVTGIAHSIGGSMGVDASLSSWISAAGITALLIFFFRKQIKKCLGSLKFPVIVLILMLASVSIWSEVLRRPDGRLHLDWVRADDAVTLIVTAPDGALLAVDPDGSMNELTAEVSAGRSPLQRSLDGVLLTRRTSAGSVSELNERMPVSKLILTASVTMLVEEVSPIQLGVDLPTSAFSTGDTLWLDERTEVQLAAADSSQTALLITNGLVRVLIPNGVDPGVLRSDAQQPLASLTALVLTPDDLQKVPPAWWQRTGAGVIFWMDMSQPPSDAWVGIGNLKVVSLVTDGEKYSVLTR